MCHSLLAHTQCGAQQPRSKSDDGVKMLMRSGTEVLVSKKIVAILIPDGIEYEIEEGSYIFIQQVLGGMFTVQNEQGLLLRIDGKDAEAIGQEIPKERREITSEE